MKRSIVIGSDHAGFEYKETIKKNLLEKNWEVIDCGPFSKDSVDYPDFVHPVAETIENELSEIGILICGSANGVSMTANKHQKIRAAICWNTEIASLARQHNNANIICLPARFVSEEEALEMVTVFTSTEFEGGRHQRRVGKISLTESSC